MGDKGSKDKAKGQKQKAKKQQKEVNRKQNKQQTDDSGRKNWQGR
jgi:hypothetical protein